MLNFGLRCSTRLNVILMFKLSSAVNNIMVSFFLFQVNRDVVLSRHKEHAESRKHTFLNATAVYDLLAITMVRRSQYTMLADVSNF